MKDREKNRRIFRTFLPLLFSTFCLADKIASSFTKLSSDDVMGKAGKTLNRYSITEEDVKIGFHFRSTDLADKPHS